MQIIVDGGIVNGTDTVPTITFTVTVPTLKPYLTRANGDWTDRYAAGDIVTVSNSVSNNAAFTIDTIAALRMTFLIGDTITQEVITAVANVTFVITTPTKLPTLVRTSGDWTTRFAAGDVVTISNSTSNNAAFTIDTVVALTMSFLVTDTITEETQTGAANVTFIITAPTISSTTVRATGDWTDTFTAGDVVTWTNSTSNNRAYTILSVVALTITWTVADSILFEAEIQTTAANLTATIATPQVKPTITRASGDWQTRFASGDTVTISNSTSNNAAFTVDTVTALVLTLIVTDTITNETQTGAVDLTAVITAPTFGSKLTRASGDWEVRFANGDQITIAATTSGNNDGAFTLTALSATVMTFTPNTDTIIAETENAATCTFTVTAPTKSPTITRASGDWTDRFVAGDTIAITNSTSNNASFTIIAGGVATLVISLVVADTIAAEVQTVATDLLFTISSGQTIKPTIIRASGSWEVYFAAGDTITVSGATGDVNAGTYTIFSVSTVTMVLILTDALTQLTEVTSVAVLFAISNDGIMVGWTATPITQET